VRFGNTYREAIRVIALVACPFGMWLGVTAPETVRALYGERWMDVVPIVAWLSIPAAIMPLQATTAWLYLATGESRKLLRQAACLAPLMVTASIMGARWGVHGVAIVTAATFTIPFALTTLWLSHRAARLALGATLACVMPAVGGSVLAAIAAGGAVTMWVAERRQAGIPGPRAEHHG
jgi:O-antigen/teichoic acid export membrane protein